MLLCASLCLPVKLQTMFIFHTRNHALRILGTIRNWIPGYQWQTTFVSLEFWLSNLTTSHHWAFYPELFTKMNERKGNFLFWHIQENVIVMMKSIGCSQFSNSCFSYPVCLNTKPMCISLFVCSVLVCAFLLWENGCLCTTK